MKKTTIKVKGMVCNSCETLIQEALEEYPAIISARVSRGSGTVVVIYDTSLLDEEKIKSIIKEQGYGA